MYKDLGKLQKRDRTFLSTPIPMVSDSFIGVEVEVEGILNREVLYYWSDKRDGSLRNNGIEFVPPQYTPIKRQMH